MKKPIGLLICLFFLTCVTSDAGVIIRKTAAAGPSYLFRETWNSNGVGSDPITEDNDWDTDGDLGWDTDNTSGPLEGAQDLLVESTAESIRAQISSPADNVYVGCIHKNVTPASSSGDGSQYALGLYNSTPSILQGFRIYSQSSPSNQIYEIRYYYNGATTWLTASGLTIATGTDVYLKAYYAKGPSATVQAWYSLNGTSWNQIGSTVSDGTDSTQVVYVDIAKNKGDEWQEDDIRVDDEDFDY